MNAPRKILLETYGDFWNLEIKIYNIFKRRLPIPLTKRRIIYLILSFAFCIGVFGLPIMGFLNHIPYLGNPFVKYSAYPIVMAKYLDTLEIDGKMPHKYVLDMIGFMLSPKRFQMYQAVVKQKNIKISLRIRYRVIETMNDLEVAMKKPKALFILKGGSE